MPISEKIFLFYIVETGSKKCFFINNSGNVDKSNDVKYFLDKSPDGWMDSEISFGRSSKYYGLNRTYTIPLKFSGDGAKIIRWHLYQGKGIESPLSLIILKYNPQTDSHEEYYTGEIDLTKATDAIDGITVNIMEGGIVKLLKTYESTVFEFPLDGSIPENFLINLDGIKLTDTFFYQINEYQIIINKSTLSAAFINNVGDNIGIEKGSQFYEHTGDIATYVTTSTNYLFSSAYPISITISGKFSAVYLGGLGSGVCDFLFWTSSGQKFEILNKKLSVGAQNDVDFSININLVADERLFFVCNTSNDSYKISQTSFKIDFTSRMPATQCWAMTLRDVFKLLVQKISDGNYFSQSTLLDKWLGLAITSGFAIRGDSAAVLKISLADLWQTVNSILNASLSNIGNDTMFLEEKVYVFDSSFTNIELNEISNLKISPALDYFHNIVKVGYAPQTYDEKSGQNEWNTTFQWQAPITKDIGGNNKELSLVSKARADVYGIEFIRYLYGGKSVTNNSADSDIFLINTDRSNLSYQKYSGDANDPVYYDFPGNISFAQISGNNFTTPDNIEFTYNGTSQQVRLSFSIAATKSDGTDYSVQVMQNSTAIISKTVQSGGTTGDNMTFVINPGDKIKFIIGYAGFGVLNATVTHVNFTIYFLNQSIVNVKRKSYDSVSGIPNPDAAYNIEDISPKRMLANHYNYLKSSTYNLLPGLFKFLTCDKNPNLSTTVNGITVTENADVPISSLSGQLFYPLIFEIDTKIPVNFIDIYNNAANGHISFKYNGKTIYGFPIEVKVRPALNESQTWKLLCSPKTNLADLLDIDIDGQNFLDT